MSDANRGKGTGSWQLVRQGKHFTSGSSQSKLRREVGIQLMSIIDTLAYVFSSREQVQIPCAPLMCTLQETVKKRDNAHCVTIQDLIARAKGSCLASTPSILIFVVTSGDLKGSTLLTCILLQLCMPTFHHGSDCKVVPKMKVYSSFKGKLEMYSYGLWTLHSSS